MTFLGFFQTYAITIKRMFYDWNWQTPFLGFIIMREHRLLGYTSHTVPKTLQGQGDISKAKML